MKEKRVAYIFDMQVDVDSRTQKEIASLIRNGYKVRVFEWDKSKDYKTKSEMVTIRGVLIPKETIGIKVQKSKGFKENIRFLIKYEIELFKWLKRNKNTYDYIHCVNLDTALVSMVCAHLFKKKVVYDVFDDYADAHNCGAFLYKVIKHIDYFVMKRCNYVIICSEKRRKQIIGPLNKLIVIHNSPDIEIRNISSNNEDCLKIAYVGNLIPTRMIEELIDIVKKHPEYELHCGGDGLLSKKIKRYSRKYSNIHYYGKMEYEDVVRLESKCDLVPAIYDPALKNNQYAAPNKFYEAISLGKPTIMVHDTGMDDMVDKYNLGLTINNSYDELEKALKSILEKMQYWKKQQNRIIKLYQKKFRWKNMERRLMKIYNDL